MSAGKGDKWRKTDFKQYYNSPFWENLKSKKPLENEKDVAIISSDVKHDQVKEQRDNHSR